jgi:hypothetical protein
VNPVSATTWLWKALRGNSITFAVLLSCAVLGVSVLRIVKEGLYAVGTPWWLVLIVPSFIIGLLAKKETVWIPDEARRRRWARGLVLGSVLASGVLAFVNPEPEPAAPVQLEQNSAGASEPAAPPASVRPRGPSGK